MNQKTTFTPPLFNTGFLIFVVVCAYFTLAQYYLINSAIFSSQIITTFNVHAELMKEPWWAATFYSSELSGTVGGILRSAASFLALYAAFLYWRKKDAALPQIKGKVKAALLLEAGYFLFFIPTVFLGFIYPATGGTLWYFGTTPVNEVLFVAGFAVLLMVLVIPTVLLKLRSKIAQSAPRQEIVKWGCIACVSYLFVVFWFNASMQWVGMLTTFGAEILLDPINLAGFLASVFGLLLVAFLGLLSALPAIRGAASAFKLRRVGLTAVAFGSYFLFGILFYVLAGGFAQRPWAWYEMIVPHNPYLWCVIFLFAGLPLLILRKR